MTILTRRSILASLILIFCLAGPAIVLYGLGWRLTLSPLGIKKTGAILVNTQLKNASVLLDGKPLESADHGSKILIGSLLPKIYSVELSAAGYRPWRQSLPVHSSRITETNAVLIPEAKPTLLITIAVEDFFLDQHGRIIWQDEQKEYFLTDPEIQESAFNLSRLFNYLKQTQLVFPGSVPITEIQADSDDKNKLYLKTQRANYQLDLAKMELMLLPPAAEPDQPAEEKNYWSYNVDYQFLVKNRVLYFLMNEESPAPEKTVASRVQKIAYDKETKRLYLLQNKELGYLIFDQK